MAFELGFLIYISVFITAVFIAWAYYDFKGKRVYTQEYQERSYHCVKCGQIYKGLKIAAPCPHCSFKNVPLTF